MCMEYYHYYYYRVASSCPCLSGYSYYVSVPLPNHVNGRSHHYHTRVYYDRSVNVCHQHIIVSFFYLRPITSHRRHARVAHHYLICDPLLRPSFAGYFDSFSSHLWLLISHLKWAVDLFPNTTIFMQSWMMQELVNQKINCLFIRERDFRQLKIETLWHDMNTITSCVIMFTIIFDKGIMFNACLIFFSCLI